MFKLSLSFLVLLSLAACSEIEDSTFNDYDSDGVADWQDACPTDPNGSVDSDGDTVCDESDEYPNDPSQSGDSDNDGVDNLIDAFPNDAGESVDTDDDGVGNNADSDDDNDGVLDTQDTFPLDKYETNDTDGDGIGDNRDFDLARGHYQCFEMVTSKGTIQLALDYQLAPISTDNFQRYVDAQFYNGLIFHRVIKNFVIQGGGFKPGMVMSETNEPIAIESANGLMNFRGTIAMARTSDPNSATSQFYINTVDNHFLDKAEASDGFGYAVFGAVINGMDVVDAIAVTETETLASGQSDVPVEDIVINSMTSMTCP